MYVLSTCSLCAAWFTPFFAGTNLQLGVEVRACCERTLDARLMFLPVVLRLRSLRML